MTNAPLKQYVIFCPEAFWREHEARQHFADYGVTAEFYRGFHGATLGIGPTLDHCDSPGYRVTPNSVALSLSHLSVLRAALSAGHETVVVYEDDARFLTGVNDLAIANTLRNAPSDWDMLFLGFDADGQVPVRQCGTCATFERPFCTHAVAYRRSGMEAVLNNVDTVCSPFDVLLIHKVLPHVKHYCVTPPICHQSGQLNRHSVDPLYPDSTMQVGTWEDIDGWLDYQNIYDRELKRVNSGVFVEVGTWLGRSAAYMATGIKRSLKPIQFFAVDTFAGTESDPHMSGYAAQSGGSILDQWRRNMVRCGVSHNVTPIVSDSAEAASRFADESVDFCFIDANHDAGACLRDIVAWYPKIKHGGTLAGHDIDFPEVLADVRTSGLRFTIDNRSWVHAKKKQLRSREDITRRNDARVSRSSRAT